ncbi:hypothetical protein MASR2M50_17610 [Thauera sp.]
MATGSLPTLRLPMISPIERMVASRPQKVPSRPRKIKQADQVAREVALLLEADLHAVEDGAGGRRREMGLTAAAVGQHARHRGEQHRLQAGGRGAAIGLLELLDPEHLALEAPDLAQVDRDADREHEEDHAVECGVGDERMLELRHQGGGQRSDEGEKDGHPGRDMDGFGEFLAFHREFSGSGGDDCPFGATRQTRV